ncbi:TPA: KilA-N domain-containing protein, partial [Vibrio cholerae]|nr:KilA-N domain-containing protein [Vibrio cholerae]
MSNQAIVCNINIRQDLYGRYSLNDLHKASGKASKHRPQHWLSNEQTKE